MEHDARLNAIQTALDELAAVLKATQRRVHATADRADRLSNCIPCSETPFGAVGNGAISVSTTEMLRQWKEVRAKGAYTEADTLLALLRARGADPWGDHATQSSSCRGPRTSHQRANKDSAANTPEVASGRSSVSTERRPDRVSAAAAGTVAPGDANRGDNGHGALWRVHAKIDERYGHDWASKPREFIGPDGYLVSTPGWPFVPVLGRSKAVPKCERHGVGEALGRSLRHQLDKLWSETELTPSPDSARADAIAPDIEPRAPTDTVGKLQEPQNPDVCGVQTLSEKTCQQQLAQPSPGQRNPTAVHAPIEAKPSSNSPVLSSRAAVAAALTSPESIWTNSVVFVEKPWLPGFVAGFKQADHLLPRNGTAEHSTPPPFVLLLTNGGDQPVPPNMTAPLTQLPSMAACFANNLLVPTDPLKFRPLPIGVAPNSDHFIAAARAHALPWAERDHRLLITPMRAQGRARGQYLAALSRPEFADLVHVVRERVTPPEYYRLLGVHRAVLSPPGRGYDCFRTWEALAMGATPLVVQDNRFDQRLFEGTGAEYIPPPEALTVETLRDLLQGLAEPALRGECVQLRHWRQRWGLLVREYAAELTTLS